MCLAGISFRLTSLILLFSISFQPALGSEKFPKFADIHIHYNWLHAELITAEEVIRRMQKENVAMTLVSSTPSHLALDLAQAGGDWVIPFFSPYVKENSRSNWFVNENLPKLAKAALTSGNYKGLGEIHFMAGRRPKPDNKIFKSLLFLAEEFQVPVLLHVDASNPIFVIRICKSHPRVKFLFAHAGGIFKAEHIREILQKCRNVWVEFSARDPWRYGGLTDDNNKLLSSWKNLLTQFPDRFMTGTDPVWSITRGQTWDQADEGWDHYPNLIRYHRNWIQDLPEDIGEKIRYSNAQRFFK